MKTTRSDGSPHDRLTAFTASMIEHLQGLTGNEADTVQAIVMLEEAGEGTTAYAGVGVHGYDGLTEAAVAALIHIQQMLAHTGHSLAIMDATGKPIHWPGVN